MNTKNQVIVLDAGNTAVKIGVFKNDEIEHVFRVSFEEFHQFIQKNENFRTLPAIISSVLTAEKTDILKKYFDKIHELTPKSVLPIELNYLTPETLGKDRICNAVAINQINKQNNSVSIDIGTCLKFDFVSDKGIYQGGSISPGINLRYKALNDFTDNLPLLKDHTKTALIGKNTNLSIHSGVINGIEAEINNLMHRYMEEYEGLTFFMTGGDAKYFDFHRKNNIFVDENLTLKGLFYIYLLNAH
jgi:type III pantothenate kinase